jgi:Superinfection immunity protein
MNRIYAQLFKLSLWFCLLVVSLMVISQWWAPAGYPLNWMETWLENNSNIFQYGVIIVLLIPIYFLPTSNAVRNYKTTSAKLLIFGLNLLIGWTGIGWIGLICVTLKT